jgi:hypothetical protein
LFEDRFNIRAKVWLYPGPGGWHFITLPVRQAKLIKKIAREAKRGWGSLPVKVTIGKTAWNTSMFPDKKSGSYVLPVKASVRKDENILEGDIIDVVIELRIK